MTDVTFTDVTPGFKKKKSLPLGLKHHPWVWFGVSCQVSPLLHLEPHPQVMTWDLGVHLRICATRLKVEVRNKTDFQGFLVIFFAFKWTLQSDITPYSYFTCNRYSEWGFSLEKHSCFHHEVVRDGWLIESVITNLMIFFIGLRRVEKTPKF